MPEEGLEPPDTPGNDRGDRTKRGTPSSLTRSSSFPKPDARSRSDAKRCAFASLGFQTGGLAQPKMKSTIVTQPERRLGPSPGTPVRFARQQPRLSTLTR